MDDYGEAVKGPFNKEELQKIIKEDNTFSMESILHKEKERRYTFLLVKWKENLKNSVVGLMRRTSRTYKKNIK